MVQILSALRMPKEKLNLKLIGKNIEDLKIISAYLQDSIVLINDIVFLKSSNSFLMMVNRFMWEDLEKGLLRKNKRIRSAIKFSEVHKVVSKNINQKNKDRILEFLTIKTISLPENYYEIKLIFSGDCVISIFAEEIEVLLDDVGEPWNVKNIPKHKI